MRLGPTFFAISWIVPSLLALSPLSGRAGGDEPTASQVEFFEKQIRPILAEHCFECHGEKVQWASLRLDSKAAMLKGGDSGPAIAPGDVEASLLIRAVRQADENLKMPQESKLSESQIAALEAWVKNGAAFSEAASSETAVGRKLRDPQHWAFQAYSANVGDLPEPEAGSNDRSPIDRFIQKRLAEAGINPAPRPTRRRLSAASRSISPACRRLPKKSTSFSPTSGKTPGVGSSIVCSPHRLTASAGAGIGSMWLATPTPTVSMKTSPTAMPGAIATTSLPRSTDDKPYDTFLIEQLAGDLLPADSQAQRHEQLIATGFLSIGPKVLAEVDEAKMQMDIVDEQIDTVGRVFLGLTLGCARCHDHKFDPIDTADYYGLAGIFKSTRTMETYKKVAKWHENLLHSPEATALKQSTKHVSPPRESRSLSESPRPTACERGTCRRRGASREA